MTKEKKTLTEIIEEISMQAMIVDYDDIQTLGSILEKLELIQQAGEDAAFPQNLPQALKSLVEKIILHEIHEGHDGLAFLRRGVGLLQEHLLAPSSPNLIEKIEQYAKDMTSLGIVLDIKFSEKKEKDSSVAKEQINLQDIELYKDFISEALDYLNNMELQIIDLEQNPEDPEVINSIFRPFHTIKGVSGFLHLRQINEFSHAVESLLDKVRNKKIKISQELIDFILEAVDLLKRMILDLKTQIEAGSSKTTFFDIQPYLAKIENLANEDKLLLLPRKKEAESLSDFKDEESSSMEEKLRDSQITSVQENKEEGKTNLKKLKEDPLEQKQIGAQVADSTIKVDTKKLDNLIDTVGELVIALSLVQQNPLVSAIKDQKLIQDFSQLKRITNELQKISMSLRMVPIRQTFQKMHRLVRDLAKKSGKLVELIMSGEDTEIDRHMVDSLYDPLVHMIRNAIDHGIEPPAVRQEKGKKEIGRINLRAYQHGGNVVIEIADDGQGLNRAKILQKAKEKGLITDEKSLTNCQIDNLIFEPGFSTAEKVTDVSGRGVGLDVVKKAIEKLKGKVEIFSEEGKGCLFVMRIPLTLAIMDGIIVRSGEERFIIPTEFVKEAIRPRPDEVFTMHKKGEMVKVRDRILPLVRLHQFVNVNPEKNKPWESLIIVLEGNGHQNGLMVDDLLGKQEVVIKNMGEKLKDVKGVAGATIMGDGRVGLILDVQEIFTNGNCV
ncbi:MAG: chemotaxis protein CheA [bacterium]